MTKNFNLPPGVLLRDLDGPEEEPDDEETNHAADSAYHQAKDRAFHQFIKNLSMIRTVYLAGLISTEAPESLAWRERVTPRLINCGLQPVTPLYGKQNLPALTTDNGLTTSSASAKSIILRDRRDVREAGIILAHLELFGSTRPLLGTIAELAWAWDQRTPVIGIAAEDNYLMRKHPFMSEFISHFAKDEDDAIAFIARYYGDYGGSTLPFSAIKASTGYPSHGNGSSI